MEIKKLNPFIRKEDKSFENDILNTEFSKAGLSEFHKKYKNIFLFVTLLDKNSCTIFDKSGTFPATDLGENTTYDPTGAYVGNRKGRKVSPDKVINITADVENVFDFINFFENNIDTESLIGG